MPRNNKTIERVFTEIVPGKLYDRFIQVDEELGLQESETQTAMKEMYVNMLANMRRDLKAVAQVEEIIIQLRAKEQIDSELRLSLSRDYIYARSLFYRIGKEINDIRVIIGKTSEFREGIDYLIKDNDFREICKNKLTEAMDKIIEVNVKTIYQLHEK